MTSQREIGAVAAIGSAILELGQIGTLENLTQYPTSAHARVEEALRQLREAQRAYLPVESPAGQAQPTTDPDAYDDDSRWKR